MSDNFDELEKKWLSQMPLDTKTLLHFKLPVKFSSGYIFDADNQMIMQVRAWGYLQYMADAEEMQDHLGEMFAQAFNEKYEKP